VIVLDTCTWIWLCADPKKLSRPAAEAIRRERVGAGLIVSTISAWEVAKLVQKGRLAFSIPCREWIAQASRTDGVRMHPLTAEISVESTELPGSFPGDPADQIVVATARVLGCALVTRDRRMLAYPHVPTLW
jgi:PIN domain nuclease of toxin-antitoxin system